MIILIGKTASGKDTVLNKLVSEHGCKKLTTYTTRPMRLGEIQDVTYHFVSEADFKYKIATNFFSEWKTYDTIFGPWYYGTAIDDLQNASKDTVIILTPQGYRDIKSLVRGEIISIYLDSHQDTIRQRLISRGDDPREAERRMEKDLNDFLGIETDVDYIVSNNSDDTIDAVVDKVIDAINDSRNR